MTLCSRSTFQLIFPVVCEHRTRIIYLELNAFIYCVELFQIQSDFLHLVAGSRFKHDCVLKTYLQRTAWPRTRSWDSRMLDRLEMYHDEEMMKYAYEICRWHHERYDGKG